MPPRKLSLSSPCPAEAEACLAFCPIILLDLQWQGPNAEAAAASKFKRCALGSRAAAGRTSFWLGRDPANYQTYNSMFNIIIAGLEVIHRRLIVIPLAPA